MVSRGAGPELTGVYCALTMHLSLSPSPPLYHDSNLVNIGDAQIDSSTLFMEVICRAQSTTRTTRPEDGRIGKANREVRRRNL